MDIRKRTVKGHEYYSAYEGRIFIRHIGNADALRVFKRDVSLGERAMKCLQQRPYLAPRACLRIIAEGKKAK